MVEAITNLPREVPQHASQMYAKNLTTLLVGGGRSAEAKALVLEGIDRFPAQAESFRQIGQRIVEATGDKAFREEMAAAIDEKGPA